MTADLPAPARAYLEAYFKDNPAKIGRTDLVLALLRGNFIEEAEALAGVPIQYGPRLTLGPPPQALLTLARQPRITRLAPNPRLPTTAAWGRYRVLKVGMTLDQAYNRGVTKRDIREALRNKWMELT